VSFLPFMGGGGYSPIVWNPDRQLRNTLILLPYLFATFSRQTGLLNFPPLTSVQIPRLLKSVTAQEAYFLFIFHDQSSGLNICWHHWLDSNKLFTSFCAGFSLNFSQEWDVLGVTPTAKGWRKG
jgi:hypothetical protein